MKSFKGPKTQNEVQSDDKLIWESFVSREDNSIDQSNDSMNDQELLNPIQAAAIATGAKDVIDWMIKRVKAQGDHFIDYFIQNVIGDPSEYDTNVEEGDNDTDVKDLQALHDNPDEEFAKKNYGSVQAYKDMLKKKIAKLQEGAFDHVSGDPSTYKVGEIIPADVSQDDYDGIIVSIDDEDEGRVFNLMQVGPEGWSVPEANLNLPDDDTGRIPQDVDTFGMKLPRN